MYRSEYAFQKITNKKVSNVKKETIFHHYVAKRESNATVENP